MKKTFALLLCLLLALSLFACKSQDEPTTTAAPARSEAVSEQGETASETKATLDFNGLTGKGKVADIATAATAISRSTRTAQPSMCSTR